MSINPGSHGLWCQLTWWYLHQDTRQDWECSQQIDSAWNYVSAKRYCKVIVIFTSHLCWIWYFWGLNFTSIHPQRLSVSLGLFLPPYLTFSLSRRLTTLRLADTIFPLAFVAQQWSLITMGGGGCLWRRQTRGRLSLCARVPELMMRYGMSSDVWLYLWDSGSKL